MKRKRTMKRRPLTYTLHPAGVCCRGCDRGPYRSRAAALPHALRCWASPLGRLGWWAGCRVDYPVRRGSNSRVMKWIAAHFDPYEERYP